MKIYFLFLFLVVSAVGFSQNNYIVKTDDGKRVLLKADYTWEYIDTEPQSKEAELVAQPKQAVIANANNDCSLGPNYTEPKLKGKIQSQLKRSKASMPYLKKRVAKDNNCDVKDVVLLDFSEQKERGTYYFCVQGKKVKYKRIGGSIMKSKKVLLVN